MIYVSILIGGTNALGQILKLSTNKGKFFMFDYVVEPVMIPVFIPFVIVANNRHIDITAILEVERSKLHFFVNKGTISDSIHF
jgi:hypothetical protein